MAVSIITLLAVHLVAVATPGPDFAVVTHRAMSHGRKAGMLTAAGIATGLIGHVVFALLGLGALLHAVPALGKGVAIVGALYLSWMAWGCLRSRPGALEASPADTPRRSDFAAGFFTNLFNPKVVLYFAGLFSQVDLHDRSALWMFALGAWIVALTFAWFALVATLFSTARVLALVAERRVIFDRALGVLLLAFAVALAIRAA